MLKRLRNYLITGAVLLAPLGATIYVLYTLFQFMDRPLRQFILKLTGVSIPGLGLVSTLFLIFLSGLLATNIFGRRLLNQVEQVVFKIPLASSVYKTTKQIIDAFTAQDRNAFKKVVMVEYPRHGMYALGFFTGLTPGEVQEQGENNLLNIFIPTTPNPTSGFLLLVPEEEVIFLEMSVEDGLKLIISGGVVTPEAIAAPAGKENGGNSGRRAIPHGAQARGFDSAEYQE